MTGLASTYGAMLLGAFFASGFSGIATVQAIVYFKLYPNDSKYYKYLVLVVWGLDVFHSGFVIGAMWDYLIAHFNETNADYIPMTIALSVIFTAVLTFFAQCFFALRIYRLSKKNLYLTAPVVILAACRLAAASVSGSEMVTLRSYAGFRNHFRWLFSVGLALSSSVDIIITLSLFFLLRRSRRQSLSLNEIIDALILYTFEIGSLTSAFTVIAMICWLSMDNLVFLGIHFVIGKLYANSLLATLNTRQQMGRNRAKPGDMMDLEVIRDPHGIQFFNTTVADGQYTPPMHINVEKSIQLSN